MPKLLAKGAGKSARKRQTRAIEEACRLSTEEKCLPGWAIEEELRERLRAIGLSLDDLVILGRNNTNTGQHFIHFDETPRAPDPAEKAEKEGIFNRRMLLWTLAVTAAGVLVAVVGILIPLL
jgi:hypothetical protein